MFLLLWRLPLLLFSLFFVLLRGFLVSQLDGFVFFNEADSIVGLIVVAPTAEVIEQESAFGVQLGSSLLNQLLSYFLSSFHIDGLDDFSHQVFDFLGVFVNVNGNDNHQELISMQKSDSDRQIQNALDFPVVGLLDDVLLDVQYKAEQRVIGIVIDGVEMEVHFVTLDVGRGVLSHVEDPGQVDCDVL